MGVRFEKEGDWVNSLADALRRSSGIACHSTEVRQGNLFVAIRGRAADGHSYIGEAIRRGAVGIVAEDPGLCSNLPVPHIIVPDTRLALAWMADQFYGHPSRALALTGITGSNGKTTIASMLAAIFRAAGLTPGVIGTMGIDDGLHWHHSDLTTPDAVSIHRHLRNMCQNGVTHAAMEVSAQGIDMRRADYLAFSCGILSNICPDHLDYHGTFDNYLAAKGGFLHLLAPATPLIVNQSDSLCRRLAADYGGPVLSASADPAAAQKAILHAASPKGQYNRFTVTIQEPFSSLSGGTITPQSFEISLQLPGLHNRENAVLAAAAALIHDIIPTYITAGLSRFRPVERRFNMHRLKGYTVVDDTALNPGSIDAVYRTVSSLSRRSLITVNAIRGNRGAAINYTNAASFAAWHHKLPGTLIVTDSEDMAPQSDRVAPEERQAFLAALDENRVHYRHTPTLREAVSQAASLLGHNDLLLLLGAQGMDNGMELLRRQAGAAPTQVTPGTP